MKKIFGKKSILAVAALMLVCAMVLTSCKSGGGSDYPTKGITVICPWAAGGGTDSCLRAFADALGRQLGQTCTVDNQTGASGITGHQNIASADTDGYTIGMITFELSTYKPLGTPLTYENYDLLCRVNTDPAAITVDSQWASNNNITDLKSFVDYCKAHPGEVRLGGTANASVWHIAAGVLAEAADIDIQPITYSNGAADATKACAGHEIEGVTVSLAEARSFIESGHLVCLGYMAPDRNPAFPDIPTCKEQGYDISYGTWRGMAVPKGLSDDQLKVLRDACEKAIADSTFVEQMASYGQEISYLNAADFASYLAQNATDVAAAMASMGLDGTT